MLRDSIRGDTPFSDFLSQCMQRGFIAALKETRPNLNLKTVQFPTADRCR
jgi:hypothetical protein